ncbi:hypothetical protein J2T13_005130 [Paenibacillus sp. DS2015]|uniref:hypothetical protein n=1 Tax=Paenibacillus sp. DS2015 TaxID=3373917 RepID=UPI003D1DC797
MSRDSQSRKYQITINNPIDKGYNHDRIKEELGNIKSILYFCMADEAGQTHHTHIYIVCSSAIRFSTLKNRFPEAHLEIARGTSEQNREYISKSGKWEKDKKHGSIILGTFEEYGEIPIERQGARNDLADLYDLIKSGASNYQIMEEAPEYLFHIDRIDRARNMITIEEFKEKFRELEVTYIWGNTGTGKTRYVLEKHGYSHVYRVTDYVHPFDNYKGEDVILFDEYHGQFKITDLLNYLDGYPLELPCRYNNKQACYTKVYIISNISFEHQYPKLQTLQSSTWEALKRRIHSYSKVD